MTPTEQDKELREAIVLRLQHAYYNRHTDGIAGVYSHAPSVLENYTDEIMQLITADRKRVALEARINTAEHIQNTMVSPTSAYYDEISANEIPDYIAELKAQQKD